MKYTLDITEVSKRYDISPTGDVRSKDGCRLSISKNGTCVIAGRTTKIHTLVARKYVAGYFGGAEVRFKDGNRRHVNAENMEWVMHSDLCRKGFVSHLKGAKRQSPSIETRRRMAEAKNKRVVVDGVECPSIKEALAVLGISRRLFNQKKGVIEGHEILVLGSVVREKKAVETKAVSLSDRYSFDDICRNYDIQPDGKIYSHLSDKFIKPCRTSYGLSCGIRVNGRTVTIPVARLVALRHVANPDGLSDVGHKDDNVFNNRADNLVWQSRQETRLKANDIRYWGEFNNLDSMD